MSYKNAICSSHLLVRLSFSFTLSNICPRGDFSLSLIRQMVKVEHWTKTTPSRGSSHFTTYHIVSLFVSLRSKSPVCGEKYATFKNTLGEARKESRQTGTSHQLPFHFMCHWVSAAQTRLKISGFLQQQQQMAECGTDEGKKKTKKNILDTRVLFCSRLSCKKKNFSNNTKAGRSTIPTATSWISG